jgi:hypothetical protein
MLHSLHLWDLFNLWYAVATPAAPNVASVTLSPVVAAVVLHAIMQVDSCALQTSTLAGAQAADMTVPAMNPAAL